MSFSFRLASLAMDDLRLILLILGSALLLLIYLWGTFGRHGRSKKQSRKQPPHHAQSEPGLRRLDEPAFLPTEHAAGPSIQKLASDTEMQQSTPTVQQGSSTQAPVAEVAEAAELIVLYVTAAPERPFDGAEVLKALARADMEYGDMEIFHHYGEAETPSGQPVFSLANIHEPGSFTPASMAEESFQGLSLFLRLPAPVDAQSAFELMLHTAQRLADALGGEVRAAGREVLDDAALARLRHKIRLLAGHPLPDTGAPQ